MSSVAPWKPATTTTLPRSSSSSTRCGTMSTIRAVRCARLVRIPACAPVSEIAGVPAACSAMASSGAVIVSPLLSSMSISRDGGSAGDAMSKRDQLVGGVAHGADHDDDLDSGVHRLADPARDPAQLDRGRDAGAAVFLDDTASRRTHPRACRSCAAAAPSSAPQRLRVSAAAAIASPIGSGSSGVRAMTDGPAPGKRRTGCAGVDGGVDDRPRPRHERESRVLVPAILHRHAESGVIADGERADQERAAAGVEDRVVATEFGRAPPCAPPSSRTDRSGMNSTARSSSETASCTAGAPGEQIGEPAEQRRRDVVAMPFELLGAIEDVVLVPGCVVQRATRPAPRPAPPPRSTPCRGRSGCGSRT